MYLDELRGAEAADPEEAALGGAFPEAGEEVERVGGGEPGLVAHQGGVVGGGLVGVGPQLAVRPVLLRGGAEPAHHLAVVHQPPLVLQVEQRGICMYMQWTRVYPCSVDRAVFVYAAYAC